MLDDEHIATLSIYPFLVNPFYRPSIYSSYIPLPFDATTHLLPVGQIPYQKNEYHHRFLGPLQTQFPIGYTNVPGVMSSMLINNDPEIKKPMNVQNSIPSDNQEVILEHEKEELHTSEQILHQNQDDFNHTSAIGLNLEEPTKMYQKKYDKIEQSTSKMNRKLFDHVIVDDLPNTITADQNQTTGSYEIGDLQPSTTFVEYDTSMPLDTINIPKTYLVSPLPSFTISNEPSKSEIYSNSVSQIPSSSDEFLNLAQKSSTTQEPSALSNSKQTITTVETYSSTTTSDKNQEYSLTAEKRSQPDEPQNSYHYSNDKYTTGILKKPITNIKEISTEIAKTTRNPKVLNESSTIPRTTTNTIFSTPLGENNDTKISTSSKVVRDETIIHTKSYNVPVQILKVSNEQDNINDLTSLPTRPSVISITTSETSTLPYNTTASSSTILQSSPQHSKYYSSTKSLNVKCNTNKNNTIQTTSLRYSSIFPTILPLNIKNITASILEETITEQTPLITLNSDEYTNKIKQNTNIPRHHDESTRSFSTPTMFIPPHNVFSTLTPVNIVQNNLPSDATTYSNNYQGRNIHTSTEKSNTYKDDNINNYIPTMTKGTKSSTLKPTVKPINHYNSVHKKIHLDVVSDDSKLRRTTNNQDRYVTETSNPPQSVEDSELWYDHMYPQNTLKKETNEKQIHVLLKKIIKLLKPEIEKQTLTKESVARLVPPKLGDPEKFVYIIYPWIIDEAKNIENEERTKTNANPLTTSDKL